MSHDQCSVCQARPAWVWTTDLGVFCNECLEQQHQHLYWRKLDQLEAIGSAVGNYISDKEDGTYRVQSLLRLKAALDPYIKQQVLEVLRGACG